MGKRIDHTTNREDVIHHVARTVSEVIGVEPAGRRALGFRVHRDRMTSWHRGDTNGPIDLIEHYETHMESKTSSHTRVYGKRLNTDMPVLLLAEPDAAADLERREPSGSTFRELNGHAHAEGLSVATEELIRQGALEPYKKGQRVLYTARRAQLALTQVQEGVEVVGIGKVRVQTYTGIADGKRTDLVWTEGDHLAVDSDNVPVVGVVITESSCHRPNAPWIPLKQKR